jgi:septum formation protein
MAVIKAPEFLLASASPRRAELLTQIGALFNIAAVDVDEKHLLGETPYQYVARLALTKAQTGFERQDQQPLPVLGSDTTVVYKNDIFGKPVDEEAAVVMLMSLSGQTHSVFSAVAIVDSHKSESIIVETLVTFRHLREAECRAYWQTGEPVDKAGAYGIQGLGAVFVNKLCGSYSNVVGLPITETCELFKKFAISWWNGNAPTD